MVPRPSQPGSPEAPAGKAVETDMTDAAWRNIANARGFAAEVPLSILKPTGVREAA